MTDDVLARLRAYCGHDAPTHGGRVLSYVYDAGRTDLDGVAAAAMAEVMAVNGLDPTTFPSVALLESDLISFGRTMLRGPSATGAVTSGGTESCLLAVKAARDLWRSRGGTGRPRIVLPTTAHAAFVKAAHYLELDLVRVPVKTASTTPDAEALLAAVDARTALVVLSAPAYPHGVIDPIADVASALAERGIPCHVDACIGGFVLPWWSVAGGGELPAWDFAVPGVTSISADLHKYGFAPKGASLLLFADPALDLARSFALTDWPGYPVVNPTVLGSRSAASLAAAWAVTQTLGHAGYVDLTRRTVEATRTLRGIVDGITGLRVLGAPLGPLLAVVTDPDVPEPDRVDPHRWCAAALKRGFVLQGQPGYVQPDGTTLPRSAHLTVTPVTADLVEELAQALPAAADDVRGAAEPAAKGDIPDPVALAQAARAGGELDLPAVLRLVEVLPREQSATLLAQFLRAFTAPQ